jgi:hypothetical protein
LAAALTAGAALAAPSPITVAVDLSGLEETGSPHLDREALESQLVLRLVQEGFAVVPSVAPAALHVTLRSTPDGLRIEAHGRGLTEARLLAPPGEQVEAEEVPRDVVAQTLSAIRAVLAPPAAPAAFSPTARRLTMSLGASALWRSTVDPLISLGVRVGRRYGFGFIGELAAAPSVGPNISVDEVGVSGGASYRWPLRPSVDLEVGARAGLWAGFYELTDASASNPSGSTNAFLFDAPVELLTWMSPRTAWSLKLCPGFVTEHVLRFDAGQLVWSRSAFHLAVGMTVQHVF